MPWPQEEQKPKSVSFQSGQAPHCDFKHDGNPPPSVPNIANSFYSDEKENIASFPQSIIPLNDNQIIIGDLHGNAMKLLYTLAKCGVLKDNAKNKETYGELFKLYE